MRNAYQDHLELLQNFFNCLPFFTEYDELQEFEADAHLVNSNFKEFLEEELFNRKNLLMLLKNKLKRLTVKHKI